VTIARLQVVGVGGFCFGVLQFVEEKDRIN